MSLHVIYGAGPLGLATARALLAQGHTVRIINRAGNADIAAQPGLEKIAGDAMQRDFNRRACAGAEALYQCAATAYSVAAWRTELRALQGGIMQAAEDSGARLVVGDNLYLYGCGAMPMREDSPVRPSSEKGSIRALLADEIMTAHARGALSAAIVRGSDFFGPHVLNSNFGVRTVLPALQGKSASLTGNIDQPHTVTFIEDFGQAMALVGTSADAMGQAWHVPNAPTITQREMAILLFNEIGRPLKIGTIGKTMMRLAGLFIGPARETVEMMYQFEQPFVVDHAKFAARFGDIATPHQLALAKTVDWYCGKYGLVRGGREILAKNREWPEATSKKL